jgi:hypothetical protein
LVIPKCGLATGSEVNITANPVFKDQSGENSKVVLNAVGLCIEVNLFIPSFSGPNKVVFIHRGSLITGAL